MRQTMLVTVPALLLGGCTSATRAPTGVGQGMDYSVGVAALAVDFKPCALDAVPVDGRPVQAVVTAERLVVPATVARDNQRSGRDFTKLITAWLDSKTTPKA